MQDTIFPNLIYQNNNNYIDDIKWLRRDMKCIFKCSAPYLTSESSESNECDIEMNTRRYISYLQATM